MDELKSDDDKILNLALQSKWDALMATTAPYIKDAMNEEAYAEFEKEQYYICMEAAFAGRSEQKYVYEPRLPPRSEEEKMLVGRVTESESKTIDALIIQEWQKERDATPTCIRKTLPEEAPETLLQCTFYKIVHKVTQEAPNSVDAEGSQSVSMAESSQ